MFIFVTKVKRIKVALIQWKKDRFRNIFSQIEDAKVELRDIQKHIKSHPLCVQSDKNEKVVIQQYAKIIRYEECIAKQKFRVKWIDLGESNTHFFHNSLKKRYSRNNILTLLSRDNVLLQEDTNIVLECVDFYSSLFDDASSPIIEDVDTFHDTQFDNILKEEDKNHFVRPVTRDEVVVALSSIGSSKIPGPNGFSSQFFKFCWSIVGDDFTAVVQNFFKSAKLLKDVNSTFLTLVAKKKIPILFWIIGL